MQKIKPATDCCSPLAENCKKALENSFGTSIPKPRAFSSEANPQPQKEIEGDYETKEDGLSSENRPTEISSCSQEADKDVAYLLEKINSKERLSKDEFQRVYDIIWKRGPVIKYRLPDKWLASEKVQETFWK
jgi:hypothetical protein